MPHPTDSPVACTPRVEAVPLPTRQRNALRMLLNKPDILPQEIAALDRRMLERAPGVGRKSLELIEAWLQSHGYALVNENGGAAYRRQARRQRRLEQAIDLLRQHGYEVRQPR